ncbi:MAG TPA: HAD family hydrolase [Gemmataceae bacterium]|jgi:HAD superfamily hydrolase (TIGR01549 family)
MPKTKSGQDGQPERKTQTGRVRGVVFDLDGTLVVEQLDYDAIRRELGFPPRTPLLEGIAALPEAEQRQAHVVLHRHEQAAALTATLNPGVEAFLERLDACGVRRAVFSRNSRAAVAVVLARCGLHFETVMAREDGPHKPSPHGLQQICRVWCLPPRDVLMIGDYLYDVQAGIQAGVRTALVTHGRVLPFADQADLTFPGFEAIPATLGEWIGFGD